MATQRYHMLKYEVKDLQLLLLKFQLQGQIFHVQAQLLISNETQRFCVLLCSGLQANLSKELVIEKILLYNLLLINTSHTQMPVRSNHPKWYWINNSYDFKQNWRRTIVSHCGRNS
ncbi:hypothetical protein RDI58_010715 [Solanum bulbocastanum]|uniref:Uncharacterized protein n=1 Tax=Solanum bulbocastanum TaxID=147425 RepID=A0AAN8YFM5_SOLBU